MDEIECQHCGWTGFRDELICSAMEEDLPTEQCHFNICPGCRQPSKFDSLED